MLQKEMLDQQNLKQYTKTQREEEEGRQEEKWHSLLLFDRLPVSSGETTVGHMVVCIKERKKALTNQYLCTCTTP